ncbi:MAG: type III pantothenate kinase [Flavobacteriales bacterium]|nr:type III pantothenate kinase [Flavobacteriales bacterium]PCH86884.1 MAG: pantothenate kinase [Flavobacteriales bacterium]
MNLTIDIGNTRTKIALFKEEKLLETQSLDQERELESFLDSHTGIRHIIFSTVGSPLDALQTHGSSVSVVHLDQDTPIPLENKYETLGTLGADRISNAVGAAHLYPKSNILVIDAGTCITLDIVNEENQYLGGSISNGIQMRFQALNTFTENLPLIGHENPDYPDLIGKSTESSIRSGVINGVVAELCGMISAYNKQFTGLKILLTGGDANYIETELEDRIDSKKNEIFADPNLVHIGLNAILNFNVKKTSQ